MILEDTTYDERKDEVIAVHTPEVGDLFFCQSDGNKYVVCAVEVGRVQMKEKHMYAKFGPTEGDTGFWGMLVPIRILFNERAFRHIGHIKFLC